MPCGKYGEKDDSEDGAPRELPYMVEKELVEKQNKHNYLLEKYIPNVLNVIPLTLKFYSKYDNICNPFLKYFKLVDTSLEIPSSRFKEPILESHKYGWIREAVFQNKTIQLNHILYPKIRTDITIFGEKLACSRVTERPKFGGIRFYLR